MLRFYEVAVAAPLTTTLTYCFESPEAIAVGTSVEVPLGRRRILGVVIRESEAPEQFEAKPVERIADERPVIPQKTLRWLQWLANYYLHPIGQVCELAFPPLSRSTRASRKASVIPNVPVSTSPHLTPEQAQVIDAISQKSEFQTHLLLGVTGSGKTEVYLNLIERCLAKNQCALVLVPEISLTPQLLSRFAARFRDKVAVIHSHLTEREKTNQWWLAHSGDRPILLGARSALFCPLPNLGLIVLDEEHESSFKQDEKLKYHARDSAMMLAKYLDIPIILGTATPSLETYQRCLEGKYQLHRMTKRVQDRNLPQCQIVDLREERRIRRDTPSDLPFWLSEPLFVEMQKALDANEQVALFLNRRGMAQVALCESCGFTYECPNCAISLTVHQTTHLVCHYCDYTQSLKAKCPSCFEGEVKPLGLGTELLESDVRQLFPIKEIARADRDEIQSREDLDALVENMENGKTDILIGTQMIAKGLDFPKLTVVGVVMADVGFHMPDFRAAERAYQLIVQVAGRAGRHSETPGRVIIQTYDPEHVSIEFARRFEFEAFAKSELSSRKMLSYPPFGKIAMIRLQGISETLVAQCADRAARRAQQLRQVRAEYLPMQVLGPAPSPMARLRGKYRYQCLLKSPDASLLNSFCRRLMSDGKWIPNGVKVVVDIDPQNMM